MIGMAVGVDDQIDVGQVESHRPECRGYISVRSGHDPSVNNDVSCSPQEIGRNINVITHLHMELFNFRMYF